MNVWTHIVGATLFICFIYLTYAIPVQNIFTLRQNVNQMTMQYQCTSMNYTDIIGDETHFNASCMDVATRDIDLAEEFSNLFYYLSHSNVSSSLNSTEEINSFFSWFNSDEAVITHEVIDSVLESLQSLYHSLLSYLHSSPDSIDKGYIEKSVAITEVLKNDLTELDHKVVGHIPRWPIIVFIGCAIWCLMGSAIYHQFYCCNFIVSNILQTIDYCGIAILISGSYVPVIYYTFYCYPAYLKLHLTTVIVLNIINVCIMATPTFR